jgi:hypothetical protein
MTRRGRIWTVVSVLFVVGNVAGAVFAALQGEALHAGGHVALALLGAYVLARLAGRGAARRFWPRTGAEQMEPPRAMDDRLANLEASVDAVAVEIERIGEGQRFMTRLFTEQGMPRKDAEGDAVSRKGRE